MTGGYAAARDTVRIQSEILMRTAFAHAPKVQQAESREQKLVDVLCQEGMDWRSSPLVQMHMRPLDVGFCNHFFLDGVVVQKATI